MSVPPASIELGLSGEGAREAKHFLREQSDSGNLDATLVLADYLTSKGKFAKAFLMVNNALKLHYRDPCLWSLLHKIYDHDKLPEKSIAAATKAAKYAVTFPHDRLAFKLLASGRFFSVIKDQFNL